MSVEAVYISTPWFVFLIVLAVSLGLFGFSLGVSFAVRRMDPERGHRARRR